LEGSGANSGKRVDTSCLVVGESERLTILSNEYNEGYTGGMNKAISYALRKNAPEFIFLLNNDAIVHRDCIRYCVTAALVHDAAVVGALVRSSNNESVLFSGGNPVRELFASIRATPENKLPEVWETGRVEGSGALIRSSFLKTIREKRGYIFEPRLFLYGDDLDLGFEARHAGKKIMMSRSAVIYHRLAHSMGGKGNPMQYYYITRNRILLANKWLSLPQKVAFHAYYSLSRAIRVLYFLLSGNPQLVQAISEAVFDGYRGVYGKWSRHFSRQL
jgi:hypothetical protein